MRTARIAQSRSTPLLHYLPLGRMTNELMRDNLAAQVEFDKAVIEGDPEARWTSINANHMLPSGSSLFHPHLQGIVDSQPTTMQRLLAAVPSARFAAYRKGERNGERYFGDTGRVEWLVSFAPIAPAELRAFIPGFVSARALDGADVVAVSDDGKNVYRGVQRQRGCCVFALDVRRHPHPTVRHRRL